MTWLKTPHEEAKKHIYPQLNVSMNNGTRSEHCNWAEKEDAQFCHSQWEIF